MVDASTTFDLLDLELLYHWFSSEITGMVHGKEVLQMATFRLGFTHVFLLHGILALAAIHLGHLNPNQRSFYLVKSFSHQNLALQAFQTALQDISPNNCEAIAAFSILLSVQSYAHQRMTGIDNLDHNDRMIMSMELVRGAATIITSWKVVVLNGDIARIFGAPAFDLLPAGKVPELVALTNFLNEPHAEANAVAARTSAEAAGELHHWCAINNSATRYGISGINAVLVWPCRLSVDYMQLLKKREPCALVVLAYYVVLLQQYDSFWMIQRWTIKLLSSIGSLVNDDIRKGWMEWPNRMCFGRLPQHTENSRSLPTHDMTTQIPSTSWGVY